MTDMKEKDLELQNGVQDTDSQPTDAAYADGQDVEANRPMPAQGEFDCSIQYHDDFYEQYMQSFQPNKKRRLFYRFVKRCFDFFVSLICLILFSPVMLVVAIAIKLDSRGPIIFKQERIGKNGKPF